MNDWYLDPPDEPEVPECCGDETVLFPDGVCVCEHCGLRYAPVPDPYDGYEPPDVELPEHGCCACGTPTPYQYCDECAKTAKCRHGNAPDCCDKCDFEDDLAYTDCGVRWWDVVSVHPPGWELQEDRSHANGGYRLFWIAGHESKDR